MKLKVLPEDFVVREIYDMSAVGPAGNLTVYKIEKRGMSTMDASVTLASALGVGTDAVRFAGLKDKHAVTVQVMSVEGRHTARIHQPGFAATPVGYCDEPVTGAHLGGNAFEVTLRDLTEKEIIQIETGLAECAQFGIPNYFDDQRFGAARSGKGFPARELVLGRPDLALKLLVSTPSTLDTGEHLARKQQLERAFGNWDLSLQLARGFHERAVFEYLQSRPADFRGALRFVPRRERLMQLFAFQSCLWNGALSRLVKARIPAGELVSIPFELGSLPAWRNLTNPQLQQWQETVLPLPSAETKCKDAAVQQALEDAAAEQGVTLAGLEIRGLRGFEFREEERPVLLFPDLVETGDPEPDKLHRGKVQFTVRLELGPGAYATFVIKRAAAGL